MTGRRIAILLVCHNRRLLTLAAMATVMAQALPAGMILDVILVDDGSTDGTSDAVRAAFPTVTILPADGSLYWNGAMTLAQQAALDGDHDFHLWLNDDVELTAGALSALIALYDGEVAAGRPEPIIIGGTVDPDTGGPTYGGYVRRPGVHPLRFQRVFAQGTVVRCETFNGNCVLVPRSAARTLGPVTPAFSGGQPLGDTDYGLRAGQAGIPVLLAPDPVGACRGNDRTSPWRQGSRSLWERLSLLRGPLGPVRRQTVVFYRRHGGTLWPLWYGILCLRMTLQALFPVSAGQPPVADPARRRPAFAMIEPVLPWYRLGVLTRLVDRGRVDLMLFHGSGHPQGEPSSPVPPEIRHRFARNLHWPRGRARVLWCNNIWPIVALRYDVVLMSEHIYTASNWLIWAVSKVLGRPRLILTGHFSQLAAPGLLGWVRRFLVRSVDFLAPYTESGGQNCQAIGVPTHRIRVLQNTLDVETIRAGLPLGTGPRPGGIFLFIGRLYPEKRADLAAQATVELVRRGFQARLLVVGAGQGEAALRALEQAGGPVTVLGACREAGQLAGIFAQAEAVILPDAAGLAVVQAFAHGVPVIVGPGLHHGVEVDYVRHGANGLWADRLTAEGLADQMQRVLTDPVLVQGLRAGAAAAADGLGMDGYTDRLEALVEEAARA